MAFFSLWKDWETAKRKGVTKKSWGIDRHFVGGGSGARAILLVSESASKIKENNDQTVTGFLTVRRIKYYKYIHTILRSFIWWTGLWILSGIIIYLCKTLNLQNLHLGSKPVKLWCIYLLPSISRVENFSCKGKYNKYF